VAALQAGEVDIIQSVPSYLVPVLGVDPDIVVKTALGTRPYWMEMNVNRPPFDDVRVRRAMNYAIDTSLIVAAFLGGRGKVLSGPLSPYNHFTDQTLEPYGYNPFLAVNLLAEAGYTAEDLSFMIDCREGEREYAEAVAAQLRGLGMRVTVKVWDYSELKSLLLAGERMAYVGGWGDSAFDPVGHFEAKWHSASDAGSVGGYGRGNFSTYRNLRVDALIKAAEIEPDEAQRRQLYAEAQAILYDEAPAVFLFVPDVVEASTAWVQNWTPSPDGRLNMHDVWLVAGGR
jgi:peptide/nickel transport system substrate-binding protein